MTSKRKRTGAIYLCDGGPHGPGDDPAPNCPNAAQHTLGPVGYVAWQEWATEMALTHDQSACPDCKLYVIWRKRGETGDH